MASVQDGIFPDVMVPSMANMFQFKLLTNVEVSFGTIREVTV